MRNYEWFLLLRVLQPSKVSKLILHVTAPSCLNTEALIYYLEATNLHMFSNWTNCKQILQIEVLIRREISPRSTLEALKEMKDLFPLLRNWIMNPNHALGQKIINFMFFHCFGWKSTGGRLARDVFRRHQFLSGTTINSQQEEWKEEAEIYIFFGYKTATTISYWAMPIGHYMDLSQRENKEKSQKKTRSYCLARYSFPREIISDSGFRDNIHLERQ